MSFSEGEMTARRFTSVDYEMGHSGGAYRTIPITTRPHLPSNVRLWLGDSIGRWEGDSLVVDTTNLPTRPPSEGCPTRSFT
jgi:hypothetical protein